MKIDFYYHFPKECTIADCHDTSWLFSADMLFEKVKLKYPDIEFNKINCAKFEQKHGWQKYGIFHIMIENPENEKYFLISFWDNLNSLIVCPTWNLKNCVELFTSTGITSNLYDLNESSLKYTPISCMPLFKSAVDHIEKVYNVEKKIKDVPHFRGCLYALRQDLQKTDNRFEITDQKIDRIDYINELAGRLINIDFHAACGVSYRSYDILGVQSCLLRTPFSAKTHNPIVPDYHFALVDIQDFHNIKAVGDAYIEKYEYLKKNKDEALWIAKNGREWYEKNSTLESHTNILLDLIDFNKLN